MQKGQIILKSYSFFTNNSHIHPDLLKVQINYDIFIISV